MAKLIAVTGATGQQGGAVVTVMLAAGWRVRAVTRDPGSAKAKRLAATGVEIVKADFSDEHSLRAAFNGAHAIFAMTSFIDYAWSGKHTVDEACALEEADALRLARAAASSEALEHYIFSTTPSASRLTGGEYPVPHMDAKARADERIRGELPGLAGCMTSLFVGFYPSNFTLDMFRPYEVILARPEKCMGRYASVQTEWCTYTDTVKAWGEVTGKRAALVRCSEEDYVGLWGANGAEFLLQLRFNASVEDWHGGLGEMFVTATELGIDEVKVGGFKHAPVVIMDQL
ncbi:NmrA-like family protein [Colletotrichum kahawae]|uniref:NmrA-like family protein n=1 Tax=Colletotrichum kahawae TaxID=34407 RepID=A0AAD9Y770_COLKA|nr:NmrA-like family protein [Colletotrichum kahawae]